jgi:mRNA interferase RelE/StbE
VTDSYKVILSKQVRKKDLPAIPQRDRQKVVDAISGLSQNPRPPQAKRLTNREEYRLRKGDYRVLYVVEDEIRVVEVRKIGHRREVYKK